MPIESSVLILFAGITAIATCLIAKYSKSNTAVVQEIKRQSEENHKQNAVLISCLTSATIMGTKFGESPGDAKGKIQQHLKSLKDVVAQQLQSY